MKKSSFFACLPLFLVLAFSIAIFNLSRAQGFFIQTTHAEGAFEAYFKILPDGYRAKITFSGSNVERSFAFGDLHLNALGEEIGWDSTIRATNAVGPDYGWLQDNDLLEYPTDWYGTEWKVRKLHLNGDPVWEYTEPFLLKHQTTRGFAQDAATGASYLIGVAQDSLVSGGKTRLLLQKFDKDSGLLWNSVSELPDSSDFESAIISTHTGGCLYTMHMTPPTYNQVFTLNKADSSGHILWSDTLSYFTYRVQENSQGDIFTCGGPPSSNLDSVTLLEKRSASGQLLWSIKLDTLFQKAGVHPFNLIMAENGDLLLIDNETNDGLTYHDFFARFDPAGHLLWKKRYSVADKTISIIAASPTPDNGFIIAGLNVQVAFKVFVLKIDADGNLAPSSVTGKLALDENVDCLVDSSEQSLFNWKIKLAGPDYQVYTTTDSSGHYELLEIPGDQYLLSAIPPLPLWESCLGDIPLTLSDTGALPVVQDFPIQIVADCPGMTVDLATYLLRPCHFSNYTVHYCNEGAVTADSVYIQVVLDPLLHFNLASIPYTQSGDTLTFPIGSVPLLECGDFTFSVKVDCDSAKMGQTLCVDARIFPDTICNPSANWSGALLEGSGSCDGDSVRFQLRNIGTAPTSNGLNFIIADDHVIMFNQSLPTLQENGTYHVAIPANGTTWRLIADQEPNAPGLEMPSVGVEGCGTGGPPSWGFLLQFPNRDGNPFTDKDCHEVSAPYDPNDKLAFPIGVDSQHFIEPNTPLDYQIRFQNTGTDTAFTVVLRDTLSPWLDPASVRPGASSHPYTWTLSGAGILTFTFENILLPDSNVNEAASHGFLQFSIDQRPANPLGALLENRAGIYFDFNPAVITNTVWHTIGHKFLTSATREPETTLPMLRISPNPADQQTTVRTEKSFRPGQYLVLRDVWGRELRTIAVQNATTALLRSGLAAGLYFVELRERGRVLAVGKVVWQ